jgi:hypothetical protein
MMATRVNELPFWASVRTQRPSASSPLIIFLFLAVILLYKSSMNYDPFFREQIFPCFFEFSVYGLHLQVLITAPADEPVYHEYRSLYSRYTGRLFTDPSHTLTIWKRVSVRVLRAHYTSSKFLTVLFNTPFSPKFSAHKIFKKSNNVRFD